MKTGKIYILTAVHNELSDTKNLLKSIGLQTFTGYSVYLVNDGSTDDTNKYISEKYPSVKIINGNGKLWWTGSLNLGLKSILKEAGNNDYVWIINNDCTFAATALEDLYRFILKFPKSIAGSYVIDSKTKKVWDCGIKIDWKNLKFSRANSKDFVNGNIDALSTKGTLYPVRVFKEIGLFDQEHFPHYFSDYDFAVRAKRKGYQLLICDRCKVVNKTDRTGFGEKPIAGIRNMIEVLFSRKSKISLQVQMNIVGVTCPPEYRLMNYLRLLSKMFHRIIGI